MEVVEHQPQFTITDFSAIKVMHARASVEGRHRELVFAGDARNGVAEKKRYLKLGEEGPRKEGGVERISL